ncbi:MAG: hypothetical protein CHACPFDD_00491 [Phycisphaerae bacterium]|nr:hypothetical protein [Phycisphaerae bacterium]
MLRDLIDTHALEEVVVSLAHACGQSLTVYDADSQPLVTSAPMSDFGRLTSVRPAALSADVTSALRGAPDRPTQSVEFFEIGGVWRLLAPVLLNADVVGFVSVGEFADAELSPERLRKLARVHEVEAARLRSAWERLPKIDRSNAAHPVTSAHWVARTLGQWCRRESQTRMMREKLWLVGSIAELMTGEDDLTTILNHIVAETARVMHCRYCSIRLYDAESGELSVAAVHHLTDRYLGKGRILRSENPIDDAALNGEVIYVEDARKDPRVRFREEARREGIISGLCTGMIYRGRPVGVLRVYSNQHLRFFRFQQDLLRAVASQAAAAVVHAQLAEQRLHDADVNRQLQLAGELQRRLVPQAAPAHPGLDIALSFETSYQVGGDLADFITLADGRTAFVIADVVGKGIPASLLMASVRATVRALADVCQSPSELMTRLNRQVCRDMAPGEFVTLLLVAVDRDAGGICICNAGHEPPLLLRDGAVRTIDEGGSVLGLDPAAAYDEVRVALKPADLVLLYTDGAVEAFNFDGRQFGRESLRKSLAAYGAEPPQQLLRNILWDIRRFTGLAEQSDDQTLIALRVVQPAATGRAAPRGAARAGRAAPPREIAPSRAEEPA